MFEPYDVEHAEREGDSTDRPGDVFAPPAELLAEEREQRCHHRDGGRHACEEEQAEPHGAEQVTERHPLEDHGHRGEAEVERPRLCDGDGTGDTEEGDGRGDRDGAAEHHFNALVGRRGCNAVEHDVVALRKVGRVCVQRAHADGQSEEDLAGRGEPHAGIAQPMEIGAVDELEALHRRRAAGRSGLRERRRRPGAEWSVAFPSGEEWIEPGLNSYPDSGREDPANCGRQHPASRPDKSPACRDVPRLRPA